MALIVTFLLGIGNFAMHKAVLHSLHSLMKVPALARLGGPVSLGLEFAMLLTVMLLVGFGYHGWAWAYAGYSLLNGLCAWLILSGRV
jgi:hypothetical protein